MKKTLLSLVLAAGSFFMASAQTNSEVLLDFETIDKINFWSPADRYFNGEDDDFGVFAIDSTVRDGNNFLTSKLKDSGLGTNGSEWQGFPDNDYLYFSFDIKSDDAINFGLKFEDEDKFNVAEAWADYTEDQAGDWATLYFDLSDSDGIGNKELVWLIDIFNEETDKVFHIDNFTAYDFDPVGLGDNIKKEGVNLFPNPTSNSLEVSVDFANAQSATVYNNFGVAVLSQDLTAGAQTLDVSSLENGAYRVVVATDSELISSSFVVAK